MSATSNSPQSELIARTQAYQRTVLEYERLDREIDSLLAAHGGASKNLSVSELIHFRDLVAQRDVAYNEMKSMERALLDD